MYSLLLLMSQFGLLAEDSSDLTQATVEARFRAEAPKGWATWEEKSRRLNAEGTETYSKRGQGPNTQRQQHWVYVQRGDLVRAAVAGQHEEACVKNGKHGFLASRLTVDAPWVAIRIGDKLGDTDRVLKASDIDFVLFEYVAEYIEAPWYICGQKLADLIVSPGFKVEAVTLDENDRDNPQVRLQFHYTPADPKLDMAIRSGWMVFSPRSNWGLTSYDTRTIWGTMKGTIVYESRDSVPLLHSSRTITDQKDEEGTTTSEVVISKFAYEDAPEKQFTLAGFGLGTDAQPLSQTEIDQGPGSGSRLLVLAITGIVVLVWANFLWCRRGRLGHQ